MKDDNEIQAEILATLRNDGPMYCGQVARSIIISPNEARWHLKELGKRGQVEHNWISGRYWV